jgi:putative salt-induced outer membrane protein YdiY
MRKIQALIFGSCFLWASSALAFDVYFKNGDKLSGTIIDEDQHSMVLRTPEAGQVKVDKASIDLPKTYPEQYAPPPPAAPPIPPPVQWKNTASMGYTQTEGNTKAQLGQFATNIDRKTPFNEETFKYDAFYSSSNRVMNGRKFDGLLRYALSFGKALKWYNFYTIQADQDRFADIRYRLNPAIGVGYWFSDTDDLKLKSELAAGYQYTAYYGETKNMGEAVLEPNLFFDKRLIRNLHLSENLTFYPSVSRLGDYRYSSETGLINQITAHWAFKMSFIDDFNSRPPAGIKKTDYTWITSLNYTF